MDRNLSDEKQLKIQTFGGLSIRYGDRVVSENTGRSKKVWELIQYLIAVRYTGVSVERLIEAVWEDKELENPMNALKNLVYRARTTLKALSPSDEKVEFIRFEHNSYLWNTDIPCVVDAEEMERCHRLGCDTSREEKQRMQSFARAVELYQGEYLPKSSFLDWVIVKNAYYATLYKECVLGLAKLLSDDQRPDEVIRLCERALEFCPYEEEIHCALLAAYAATGQEKKAAAHYSRLNETFFDQFGVSPSPETTALYKSVIKSLHNIETDLSAIKDDLREICDRKGAFCCDYDIFQNIYRLQARSMARTGSSIYIALLTITDERGEVPSKETIKRVVRPLYRMVAAGLRRGDVVAPYSSTQFVVMLPMTTYESAKMVTGRLLSRCKRLLNKEEVKVTVTVASVDPVEEIGR